MIMSITVIEDKRDEAATTKPENELRTSPVSGRLCFLVCVERSLARRTGT